jgi:hypothetical protein
MSDKSSNGQEATNNPSLLVAMQFGVADGELSIMSNPPSRKGSAHLFDRIEPTVWVGHSAKAETGEAGLVDSNFECARSAILWRPTMVMVCPYTKGGAPTVAERDKLPAMSKEKDTFFNENPVLVVIGRIFSFAESDLPRNEWQVPNPIYGKDEHGRQRDGQVLSWCPMKVVELEYTRK